MLKSKINFLSNYMMQLLEEKNYLLYSNEQDLFNMYFDNNDLNIYENSNTKNIFKDKSF